MPPQHPIKTQYNALSDPAIFNEIVPGAYPGRVQKDSSGEKFIEIEPVLACNWQPIYPGAPSGILSAVRSMTAIHHLPNVSNTNNPAIWTPAPGNAIRLMGFDIVVDPATTTAAESVVELLDTPANQVIVVATVLPVGPVGVPYRFSSNLGPNGILLNVGDVIGLHLSAACLTGGVYVDLWGCEE